MTLIKPSRERKAEEQRRVKKYDMILREKERLAKLKENKKERP